jgi:hypothetical protein
VPKADIGKLGQARNVNSMCIGQCEALLCRL